MAPTCRYHAVRMKLSTEPIAFRAKDNPFRGRQVFRCPRMVKRIFDGKVLTLRCPWMELASEPERINRRLCETCGAPMLLSNVHKNCNHCLGREHKRQVGLQTRFLTKLAKRNLGTG